MSNNKTLGTGITIGDVRFAVSVKWQPYPFHTTRQIRITVGGLCVFEALWDAAGRDTALERLAQIGGEPGTVLTEALRGVEV